MLAGRDGVVVIDGDTVKAVGKRGDVVIPEGARVIDATGKTIVRKAVQYDQEVAIKGVPLDTYRATVTLNGRPMQIQIWDDQHDANEFHTSVTHDLSMGPDRKQFLVAVKP